MLQNLFGVAVAPSPLTTSLMIPLILNDALFQVLNRPALGFEEIHHEAKYDRKRFSNAIVS